MTRAGCGVPECLSRDGSDGSLYVAAEPALAFLTTAATVTVTTSERICIARAIRTNGTIDTTGFSAQDQSGKSLLPQRLIPTRFEYDGSAHKIVCAGDNDCVNCPEHTDCRGHADAGFWRPFPGGSYASFASALSGWYCLIRDRIPSSIEQRPRAEATSAGRPAIQTTAAPDAATRTTRRWRSVW